MPSELWISSLLSVLCSLLCPLHSGLLLCVLAICSCSVFCTLNSLFWALSLCSVLYALVSEQEPRAGTQRAEFRAKSTEHRAITHCTEHRIHTEIQRQCPEPESRAERPEPKSQCRVPDLRAQSPEHRAQSTEYRAESTENRARVQSHSPEH